MDDSNPEPGTWLGSVGVGWYDKGAEATVAGASAQLRGGFEFTSLTNLTMPALLKRLGSHPRSKTLNGETK